MESAEMTINKGRLMVARLYKVNRCGLKQYARPVAVRVGGDNKLVGCKVVFDL